MDDKYYRYTLRAKQKSEKRKELFLRSNATTYAMIIIGSHVDSYTYSICFSQNNIKIQENKTADTVMNIKKEKKIYRNKYIKCFFLKVK
jgi:hypothetical protein